MIQQLSDIGPLLLGVEKPARYTGGEYGRLAKKDAPLQTLIAFPDLYEIGMSNQALRIIYNGLNRIPGISCDRAFAPAPDFEQLLRDKSLSLYGLDTGISLKNLDLLLFTLGYELGISGILAMLDVSGIPLRIDQRGEDDPLIIAGGPAVSNPLPYSNFIDAFWIGEAEAGFFDLAQELLTIKQNGGSKAAMFERIKEHPHIWVKGKGRAVRAVDASFAEQNLPPSVYPIPSMKIVQQHGILEIMRGCPNGCRFCHAGYWYRPMRQKNREALVREAGAFITQGGYREISLSSLSTGDYSGIGELVDALNERFSGRHVSFQLPSLRVSSFSLPLLEKVSQTRKSGLTFAVETPLEFWQLAINKQVTADSVVEILKEAKRNGWRGAKFYFMIGLPVPSPPQEEHSSQTKPDSQSAEPGQQGERCPAAAARAAENIWNSPPEQTSEKDHKLDSNNGRMAPQQENSTDSETNNNYLYDSDPCGGCAGGLHKRFRQPAPPPPGSAPPAGISEELEIVNFVINVAKRTSMHFNINVGIFVPKPHTPYQWAQQIDRETAAAKLDFIRSRLKPLGHKVSVSDTLVSMLEGILSRGDERAGDLAEEAFRAGSRLDAWQEFIAKDTWQGILEKNPQLTGEFTAAKDIAAPLPWQAIVSGIAPGYVRAECEKSANGKLSPLCGEDCVPGHSASWCGVCSRSIGITRNSAENPPAISGEPAAMPAVAADTVAPVPAAMPEIWRMLFTFSKEDSAVFHGHLSLIEIFSMAMARAGLDVLYTQGFNPLAKLEIVSPLSLGISAGAEIAAVDFAQEFPPPDFLEKMNAALPEGIQVNRAESYHIPIGSKKHSLSSLLWGFGYDSLAGETAYIPASGEKAYREQCLSAGNTVFSLRRTCVLAKNIAAADPSPPWAPYFDIYRHLYP